MVSMFSSQCFAAEVSPRMNEWGHHCLNCGGYVTERNGSDPCQHCKEEAYTYECTYCGNWYMICHNGHYNNIYTR